MEAIVLVKARKEVKKTGSEPVFFTSLRSSSASSSLSGE
jgi:hypothetical protein